MKVVAFNGSARKDGNTTMLVKYVFAELKKDLLHSRFPMKFTGAINPYRIGILLPQKNSQNNF